MTVDWQPLAQSAFALSLTFGACALSGALHTARPSRRVAALGVAALTVFTPFLAAPSMPAARFLCAGGTALALFRNLDLLRDRLRSTAVERAVHLLFPFDTRRVQRASHHIRTRAWLRAFAFAIPTAVSVALLIQLDTAPTNGATAWFTRYTLGTIAAYCSMEVVVATHHAGAALLGFTLPKLHDNPIFARTLGEFWGRRWNLSVRDMLHQHVFRPLARRHSLATAQFVTFGASALLHAWLLLASGGVRLALSIASYFVIQGALVLLEQRARIRQRAALLQRTWTATAILLPLPLLLEPLLSLLLR